MLTILVALALLAPIEGPGPVAPQVALPVRVVTVYHATVAECDGDPLTTADGTTWETIAGQRIAAVSQELLWWNGGPVRWGDAIWVDIPDERLAGLWWVRDTMWAGVQGYVDLAVPEGIMGCWRAAGAVLKHPESCRLGATVYHIEWR